MKSDEGALSLKNKLKKYGILIAIYRMYHKISNETFSYPFWRNSMMRLKDIKKDQNLVDAIDWDMTPEEAVRLYLEWGNNWAGGNYVIRSKDDITHYFVVNTWGDHPVIYLIQRNSEEARELAKINIPDALRKRYIETNGNIKGVYSVEGEIRDWLREELNP